MDTGEQEMRIDTTNKYKLYLAKQLGQYIVDKRKLHVATEEMYQAFLHGVSFGQGRLDLEIEEE